LAVVVPKKNEKGCQYHFREGHLLAPHGVHWGGRDRGENTRHQEISTRRGIPHHQRRKLGPIDHPRSKEKKGSKKGAGGMQNWRHSEKGFRVGGGSEGRKKVIEGKRTVNCLDEEARGRVSRLGFP